VTGIPDQWIPEPTAPGELARLTVSGTTTLAGGVDAECELVVIHRVDGCALYGVPTTGRGIVVTNPAMSALARVILRYAGAEE
jgi:hypothetical protein